MACLKGAHPSVGGSAARTLRASVAMDDDTGSSRVKLVVVMTHKHTRVFFAKGKEAAKNMVPSCGVRLRQKCESPSSFCMTPSSNIKLNQNCLVMVTSTTKGEFQVKLCEMKLEIGFSTLLSFAEDSWSECSNSSWCYLLVTDLGNGESILWMSGFMTDADKLYEVVHGEILLRSPPEVEPGLQG